MRRPEIALVAEGKETKEVIWEPMPGKVVVRTVGERETFDSAGLIWRPPSHVQPRTTGEVIAVYDPFIDYGDKEETQPFVKVGDLVVFGKHGGIEIEFGSDKVIVLREQEILTRVKLRDKEAVAELGVARGTFDDLEG